MHFKYLNTRSGVVGSSLFCDQRTATIQTNGDLKGCWTAVDSPQTVSLQDGFTISLKIDCVNLSTGVTPAWSWTFGPSAAPAITICWKEKLTWQQQKLQLTTIIDSPISSTACYEYLGVHLYPILNLETHFQKKGKKAVGRVNLLRLIRSSIDTPSAQRIYHSMIMPIFTYCGYNSDGWSESRKRMIRSIESRSLEIISPKCLPQNCDLRFLTIDNFLQNCIWLPSWNCMFSI